MFARLVTRRPSTWAAAKPSASAARRFGRESDTGRQRTQEAAQGQLRPISAKAAHQPGRRRSEHRVAAFWLSPIDVRYVHLHKRDARADKGVAEGETGVAVGAGIDDRPINLASHFVNGVDELAFAVMLNKLDLDLGLASHVAQCALDVDKGLATVRVPLTNPKQVEVRSVDDRDFHRPPVANTASMLPHGATYPPSKAEANAPRPSTTDSVEKRVSIEPTSPPPAPFPRPFVDWPSTPNSPPRTAPLLRPNSPTLALT